MLLGQVCTRRCAYCNVGTAAGGLQRPDPTEPARLARAVRELGLDYVVLTSVTRDDLPDGGAAHFAEAIRQIKKVKADCRVEVLVPDFCGDKDVLSTVLEAGPDVFGHNIETVRRIFRDVRPQGSYLVSLKILRFASKSGAVVKSGFMVGLGENRADIDSTLDDLLHAGVSIVTIGQYLQPSATNIPVSRYYTLEEFEELGNLCMSKGFGYILSGPLVRSSYKAKEAFEGLKTKKAPCQSN